jgi:ppGpp synthetase/RelA/SpoT-type nucleotidyltranferase
MGSATIPKRKATTPAKRAQRKAPVTADEATTWYRAKEPLYASLTTTAKAALESMLVGTAHLGVVGRVKGEASFLRKVERKRYTDLDARMTDMAGLRIIAMTEDDVEAARMIVETAFRVHRRMSGDKRQSLGEDQFGYLSIHLTCDLGASRVNLIENRSLKGLLFEVQIRTVLQHAWAEIEHDRVYKLGVAVPSGVKRRFSRIAALLETADVELNSVCREVEALETEQRSERPEAEFSRARLPALVEALAAGNKIGLDKVATPTPRGDQMVLEELHHMGVRTVGALAGLLTPQFVKAFKTVKRTEQTSWIGLVRDALMYRDMSEYFKRAWRRNWGGMEQDGYALLSTRYGKTTVDALLAQHEIFVGP